MHTALKLWAAVVAALYALLAYGSYVTLPGLAGGMLGFDMRPLGMSVADGRAYLDAITDAGVTYYTRWLKPLDGVFIVSATGLLLALAWKAKGALGWLSAGAALGYAGFDWVENGLVGGLLAHGAKAGTLDVIATIAAVTTAKFASLAVAIILLVIDWRRQHAPR